MLASDLNKFEKVIIKNEIRIFQLTMRKILTIIWTELKNQDACLPNNSRKLKQLDVEQEYCNDFLKYMNLLLMFLPNLDVYFLQLELQVTKLQNF